MERCIQCESAVEIVFEEHRVEVVRHTFVIPIPVSVCESCGRHTAPLEAVERAELHAAAWLAKRGVREREVFRFMRKALGMRAIDLAKLLDVTPETVSRWERGALPVEQRAFALLGTLVCERAEGRDDTFERLRALVEPPTAPKGPVRLPPVAA